MTSMHRSFLVTAVAVALSAGGAAYGQGTPLAAGQVPGSEIQGWLDGDGFAMAGLSLANGCFFMARSNADGRRQTVDCPSQASPFTVLGEGKVVGNQFCSKFSYPDGSRSELCFEIYRIGENRYETRSGTMVRTVFSRLTR